MDPWQLQWQQKLMMLQLQLQQQQQQQQQLQLQPTLPMHQQIQLQQQQRLMQQSMPFGTPWIPHQVNIGLSGIPTEEEKRDRERKERREKEERDKKEREEEEKREKDKREKEEKEKRDKEEKKKQREEEEKREKEEKEKRDKEEKKKQREEEEKREKEEKEKRDKEEKKKQREEEEKREKEEKEKRDKEEKKKQREEEEKREKEEKEKTERDKEKTERDKEKTERDKEKTKRDKRKREASFSLSESDDEGENGEDAVQRGVRQFAAELDSNVNPFDQKDSKQATGRANPPKRSTRGRPQNSRNKGPSKQDLRATLQSLSGGDPDPAPKKLSKATVPTSTSSTIKTRSSVALCDGAAAGGSGGMPRSLPAKVNGGMPRSLPAKVNDPLFSEEAWKPRKNFEPEMMEAMEATIKSGLTSKWEDVVGLDDVKRVLQESVVLPIVRPQLFRGIRRPAGAVLLYGPPGTGKTMLARCAASSAKCTFFNISASDLTSKWHGDGEKQVAVLFHLAEKHKPSIIFFDEIDAIMGKRHEKEQDSMRRLKTEMLTRWDGLEGKGTNVIIIAATNRPQDLDDAGLRRFDRHIYVPLPTQEAREDLIRNLMVTDEVEVKLTEHEIKDIALSAINYSASDIKNFCREAAMLPLRDMSFEDLLKIDEQSIRPVTYADLIIAMSMQRPTCSAEAIQKMEEWGKRH